MIGFDSPWVLLLLVGLPLVYPAWSRRVRDRPPARLLRHPALGRDTDGDGPRGGQRWLLAALLLALAALIVALARPVWVGESVDRQAPARSIVLLVDASPSMSTRDFRDAEDQPVSRMAVMREALEAFIDAHPQDRFSLMVVTDSAGTLVPETDDHGALRFWIEQLEPGLDGSATALGDGLAVAMESIAERRERGEAPPQLLVWTDGVNTGGEMSPAEALTLARAENIELFTINLAPGDAGPAGGDPTLEDLARLSGGEAIAAGDREALLAVTDVIERHQPESDAPDTRRERHPLIAWFLALGLAALLVAQFLKVRLTA
ncbi:VWA domain-containing protein [Guyparkeria halophila]|uniref:VWA domain-containing protein n=1 Tax=Guyparkeria halophila TaxID=47960 RepID=A0A6I6CYY2_9GAMM|nr:VWA domain-containing protein [Guyparkeria halophila]QGT79429.1 VWA domain-containing protein [Guyparkeria halophila]